MERQERREYRFKSWRHSTTEGGNMKPLQLLFAIAALTASCVWAQDFVSVAPKAKVLKDDGRIRVIDYQPTAGDTLPMHSHPTMIVYLVKGGTTRFTLEDGRTTQGNAETGAVLINPPVTHSQEHITDSHAILFEIAEGTTFESPSPATDLVSLAPDHCKLLKENDRFLVYEYSARKGDKVAMHSHPAHIIYLIKAGKTQFTLLDGTKPTPVELKDGAALINPPVTHAQEHLEDVRAIIVELKR
jgi:quercetin dioxygenase-like cupin family protein